jgi:HD-GYP domain-containing protein (c-di-GMP phosphodiesterase class II)
VIAAADSFDAMTSDRPYHAGMPITKAAQILRDDRGKQWKPAIIDAFLNNLGKQHPQTERSTTATKADSISTTKTLAPPAMI